MEEDSNNQSNIGGANDALTSQDQPATFTTADPVINNTNLTQSQDSITTESSPTNLQPDSQSPVQPQNFQPNSFTPDSINPIPQKKSLKVLWISLSVLVVLSLITSLSVFFFAKSNADKVANSYSNEVNSYIEKVNKTSTAYYSVVDLEKELSSLPMPKLKKAPLSITSSKYKNAKSKSTDLGSKLELYQSKIKSYAEYETFIRKVKNINADLAKMGNTKVDASNGQDVLKSFGEKLDSFYDEVHKANVPKEIEKDRINFDIASKTCVKSWHELESAYDIKDRASYISALNKYENCISPLTTAAVVLSKYYDNIDQLVKEALKDINNQKVNIT